MYTYSLAFPYIAIQTQTHVYYNVLYEKILSIYPVNSSLADIPFPIVIHGFTSQEPAILGLQAFSAPGCMDS